MPPTCSPDPVVTVPVAAGTDRGTAAAAPRPPDAVVRTGTAEVLLAPVVGMAVGVAAVGAADDGVADDGAAAEEVADEVAEGAVLVGADVEVSVGVVAAVVLDQVTVSLSALPP
jgi:hypothetical protein